MKTLDATVFVTSVHHYATEKNGEMLSGEQLSVWRVNDEDGMAVDLLQHTIDSYEADGYELIAQVGDTFYKLRRDMGPGFLPGVHLGYAYAEFSITRHNVTIDLP